MKVYRPDTDYQRNFIKKNKQILHNHLNIKYFVIDQYDTLDRTVKDPFLYPLKQFPKICSDGIAYSHHISKPQDSSVLVGKLSEQIRAR